MARSFRVSDVTPWIRAAGIVIFALGVFCMPLGPGVSPISDLSVFTNLADAGLFIKVGLAVSAVGVVLFFLSFLLPDEPGPRN